MPHTHTPSRSPILAPALYDGAWDAIKNFDYVLYPMSWFFEREPGASVIAGECDYACLLRVRVKVVFGWQDRSGVVASLSLGKLLASMVRPGRR